VWTLVKGLSASMQDGNKGVSDKQIRLTIFSLQKFLTLAGFPVITKVPVGDQPTDIEVRIRIMIISYIKQRTLSS
jgi:dynamin 1-like protein